MRRSHHDGAAECDDADALRSSGGALSAHSGRASSEVATQARPYLRRSSKTPLGRRYLCKTAAWKTCLGPRPVSEPTVLTQGGGKLLCAR